MLTVARLATSLSLSLEPVDDLRERALPTVLVEDFPRVIHDCWRHPHKEMAGESNVAAQARALAVLRRVLARHDGRHVVLSTHGNLLALILNGLDSRIGYEFWRGLSFPDVYRLEFDSGVFASSRRCWKDAG
jgi:2,3-bisphosphoglycerate-dependent phosphoglycerate mutase